MAPTIAERIKSRTRPHSFDGTVANGGAVRWCCYYTPTADQNVHVFGFKALAGPFQYTHSVTKGPGTQSPTLVRKIKFNATHGRLKRGGALFLGLFGNLKFILSFRGKTSRDVVGSCSKPDGVKAVC